MHPTLATLKAEIVSQPFKRAQLGLFQGKSKQYGNNVPFSKHKTRRSWLPNIHSKRLFSDALDNFVTVKLTTRALKTIHKHGGVDQYLTKGTMPKDLSEEGMRLRVLIQDAMKKPKVDMSEPLLERQRAQALRQEARVLHQGFPTLKDAEQTRKEAMRKLAIVTPNHAQEDPYFGYKNNSRTIAEFVHQQALTRRTLARGARHLTAKQATETTGTVENYVVEDEDTSERQPIINETGLNPPQPLQPNAIY